MWHAWLMYLQKTDQAVLELARRDRKLLLKERALLLLADGQKSDTELLAMVQAEAPMLQSLVAQGFLVRRLPAATNRTPSPPTPSPTPLAADTPPAPRVAADTFDGKRSLATTRMFLFDLTERMFSRRDPALAQAFRDRFREARDRASMVAVSRELLQHIEEQAGASRADEISARLAMLLPDEVSA